MKLTNANLRQTKPLSNPFTDIGMPAFTAKSTDAQQGLNSQQIIYPKFILLLNSQIITSAIVCKKCCTCLIRML